MKTTKNTTWTQRLYSLATLKQTILYIFRSAKEHHTQHGDIMNSIKARVYEDPRYTTLPNYMRSKINGYIEANYDLMYDSLEWVHWYDGKFVGKDLPYGDGFKQELIDQSSHVYIGTQDTYS